MGRHSASYLAARQAHPARTAIGASAKYVGRVGALAMAMGVGAAVVGGAGLANADGAAADGPGGGGAASSPDPGASTPSGAEPSTDGATGVKTPKPDLLGVPKMVLDITSSALTGHRDPEDADAEQGAPPGLTSRTARRSMAAGADGATAAGSPKRDRTQEGARPVSSPSQTRPTSTDGDPAASFVRTKTDELAKAIRGDAQPLAAVPSPTADTPRRQRLAVSPSPTPTSEFVTAFAAPVQAAPAQARPIATIVSGFFAALGIDSSANTGGLPGVPAQIVYGALQLIHREIERFVANLTSAAAFYSSAQTHVPPATASEVPSPSDEAQTAYGDIGKWMLEPDGQISDYGGQPYNGKALLEPVNVVIVDPTSTSSAEAAAKLNAAMFWAGFPAQPIHTTGFLGTIDDVTYGQQPTGLLQGFSDNFFLFPNDHGRIFGPDPVQTSTGYVWSGAFSTETLGIYNFLPAHFYVSSDLARTALATRLILSGQATYVGMVALNNAYDTATTTTGDHDGYAVVLQLR
jgi:hypothetical protein